MFIGLNTRQVKTLQDNVRMTGGGRDCVSRKIEEIKNDNETFKAAKKILNRLIDSGAEIRDIERAQYILYGIEKDIREEAVRYCSSSIMPAIIAGASKVFSKTSTLALPALAAFATYRLSGVPTKMVVGTTAIAGSAVGSVVGATASAAQAALNFGLSGLRLVGVKSELFSFAEGIGAEYGKTASHTVLESIKGLGEEDVKLSFAICIFIALYLLLQLFIYIGHQGDRIMDIVQTKEVSFSATPLGIQVGVTVPGGTRMLSQGVSVPPTHSANAFKQLLFQNMERPILAATPAPVLSNNSVSVPALLDRCEI